MVEIYKSHNCPEVCIYIGAYCSSGAEDPYKEIQSNFFKKCRDFGSVCPSLSPMPIMESGLADILYDTFVFHLGLHGQDMGLNTDDTVLYVLNCVHEYCVRL